MYSLPEILWIKSLNMAWLGPVLGVTRLHPSCESGKNLIPDFFQVVGLIPFLVATDLKNFDFLWPLAIGCPQLSEAAHHSLLPGPLHRCSQRGFPAFLT